MTITQLRYFQKACKLENITRAAEALHVSQPSVSAAIRELEQEFGYPLLVRSKRSFSLTPKGGIFLEEVDRLLSHVDNFETAMSQLGKGPGRVAVGVPPMIGSLVLPRIYASGFLPDTKIELSIVEAGRQELLRLLASNELDMAFLPHDRPLGPGYSVLHLTKLETMCCVSTNNPLALRQSISVKELEGEPLVLFKNSFFQTERIIARFQAEAIEPKVLLQTDQLSTIRKLVSCDTAVGFLFGEVSSPLPNIASIPLDPPMVAQVSLVWRGADYLSKQEQDFIEFVRSLNL